MNSSFESCLTGCLPFCFRRGRSQFPSLRSGNRSLYVAPFPPVSRLQKPLTVFLHRKEVIQPHLPIRLPCYDLTPITNPTFGSALLAVRLLTSGVTGSHSLTGGVYKPRERIHRGMLIHDY